MAATWAQIRDACSDAILAIVTNGAQEVEIAGRKYKALDIDKVEALFVKATAMASVASNSNRVPTALPTFANPAGTSDNRGREWD